MTVERQVTTPDCQDISDSAQAGYTPVLRAKFIYMVSVKVTAEKLLFETEADFMKACRDVFFRSSVQRMSIFR